MTRRAWPIAIILALLLSALIPIPAAAAEAPLPDTMAAVGDSITQAASTGLVLGADAPQNSWSTGTSSSVNSHYRRLLAAGAPISGRNYNRSVSGAKVADLVAQMQTVVGLQPDYVTVLIGGNDLCTDTVEQMTSVPAFHDRFEAAMVTLTAGSPTTNVYVVSIPDVHDLWSLFKGDFFARFIWDTADICQSLLANPTSTQQVDVDRRNAVRQRNIDFNAQLASVCAQFDRCLFDGNAVFNTAFTTSDVSGDYFHPSVTGQTRLSAVSWAAGYRWTATPPPPPPNQAPTAAFASSCASLACSFADGSTDDGGAALLTRSWDFGDGAPTSTAVNPSHAYASAGTYTVTLTVTDGGGLADSEVQQLTVAEPLPVRIFVEALSGVGQPTGRNTWAATATITLADTDGRPVSGATVSGTWSLGAGDTCVTDLTGRCTVTSDNLNKKKIPSVTFDVTDAQHATLTYDAALNLDTSIAIGRP